MRKYALIVLILTNFILTNCTSTKQAGLLKEEPEIDTLADKQPTSQFWNHIKKKRQEQKQPTDILPKTNKETISKTPLKETVETGMLTKEEVNGPLVISELDKKSSADKETLSGTPSKKPVETEMLTKEEVNGPPVIPELGKNPSKDKEAVNSRLIALEKRVTKVEDRVKSNEGKLSDLQRLIAEAEDNFLHDADIPRGYYFWTTPFNFGISKLNTEQKKGLDILIEGILTGGEKIERKVIGYGDILGTKKVTYAVSEKRAQECINYLIKKLGPNKSVPWDTGTKWKDYFNALAGGPTKRYGSFKHNRRVRFERRK